MSFSQHTKALARLPGTQEGNGATRERAVRNSLLIREVNERIAELSESWLDGEPRELLCECGDESCIQVILVTRADYEVARNHSDRYLITPDHGEETGTKVRTTRDGYSIVEYAPAPAA